MLLTPQQFRNAPLGANLSNFAGPVGDALLANYLDMAQGMIESYIGFSLEAHVMADETGDVLDSTLPIFPLHVPLRAILSFQLLAWASQAGRQTWTIPTQAVENVPFKRNPLLYGNVQVNRTEGYAFVRSYAGALGFPWTGILQASSQVVYSYTAGYDVPGQTFTALSGTVQASPAPTTTTFAVEPGTGQWYMTNLPLTVGLVPTGKVLTIVNDLITVPAMAQAPAAGAAVTQSDGVVFPAPNWLLGVIRTIARDIVNIHNATAAGASSVGTIRMGQIQWTLPPHLAPTIPASMQTDLDMAFNSQRSEIA